MLPHPQKPLGRVVATKRLHVDDIAAVRSGIREGFPAAQRTC